MSFSSSTSTSSSSSCTVADENLLNNSSSPADQTIVVNSSKRKFPAKLIDRVERNEDGQKVLKAIFLHVRSNGGYDKCFGFGKKGRFLDGAASALFNVDGLLNNFAKPPTSGFKTKFNNAQTLLEELLKHSHSDGNAEDEESYPPHLSELILIYSTIKNEAETTESRTVSQVNREEQDRLMGNHAPTGPKSALKDRASTRAENQKLGYDLADRNAAKDATAVLVVTGEKANNSRKKDSKKTPKRFNAKETLSQDKETRSIMANAFQKIAEGDESKDARLELDKEKFQYSKDKTEMERAAKSEKRKQKNEHFEKTLDFKKLKAEVEKSKAAVEIQKTRLQALREVMENAKVSWKEEEDSEVKDVLKQSFMEANRLYMKSVNDL